jgi:Na+-transporting methylmalonyl-CoA/oxaloacetate decarboxylase beta subunit
MKKLATIVTLIAVLILVRSFLFPEGYFTQAKAQTQIVAKTEQIAHIEENNTQDNIIGLTTKGLKKFYSYSGFANATTGHMVMIFVGLFFIFLAIRYDYEPLLLIPIGTGILLGNIPFFQGDGINLQLGIYQEGSVLNYLYFGVVKGIYPPLIFLGIGAMTDFSSLISKPRLMLLGAAAQVGIFLTFLGALYLGFHPREAGAIGIIGGADGPTAIFLSSKLANGLDVIGTGPDGQAIFVKNLIGPIAIAAYSYMALVSCHSTTNNEAAHHQKRASD